jgi:hypothetical protein
VVGARLEIDVPVGDLAGDILGLVLPDEAMADVLYVDLVPVESVARVGAEVSLGVFEQLGDIDGVSFKGDLVAVAEAEVEVRLLARGLGLDVVEAAPVADDLIEAFLAPLVGALAIFLDGSLPELGALRILAAVFVLLGQVAERSFAERRAGAVGDTVVDGDPVEFVGTSKRLRPVARRAMVSLSLRVWSWKVPVFLSPS